MINGVGNNQTKNKKLNYLLVLFVLFFYWTLSKTQKLITSSTSSTQMQQAFPNPDSSRTPTHPHRYANQNHDSSLPQSSRPRSQIKIKLRKSFPQREVLIVKKTNLITLSVQSAPAYKKTRRKVNLAQQNAK